MGFGLLLVGYFTATIMSLNSLGAIFSLLGYIILAVGAKKLSAYNTAFSALLAACIPMMLLSGAIAVGSVSSFLFEYMLVGSALISEELIVWLSNIKLVADLVFAGVLCYSIKKIAVETGAQKVPYLAVRNFVFCIIATLLQLFSFVCVSGYSKSLYDFAISTALPVWSLLITLFSILLICLMLFSCYRQICDVDDVDMAQKPSRFEFVNRRRAEKEAKRQKYIAEAEAYLEGNQLDEMRRTKRKRKRGQEDE